MHATIIALRTETRANFDSDRLTLSQRKLNPVLHVQFVYSPCTAHLRFVLRGKSRVLCVHHTDCVISCCCRHQSSRQAEDDSNDVRFVIGIDWHLSSRRQHHRHARRVTALPCPQRYVLADARSSRYRPQLQLPPSRPSQSPRRIISLLIYVSFPTARTAIMTLRGTTE